jgi:hypothetical protein
MDTSMKKWTLTRIAPNVHALDLNLDHIGESVECLFQADEHWDNAHCRLDLLKRHHDEAKELAAPIFKFGDTFCAMQGKWDKRASQSQLRPEHRGSNYLDSLVKTASEWYRPYQENIALICPGNHETSILKRHETNLTERLCDRLGVEMGGYWGYVIVRLNRKVKGGRKSSYALHVHYHHGYGGGGEVTRGLIDNNRTRGQYIADIYFSGHIHRRNMDENQIVLCNRYGRIETREQVFLRLGTYKAEHDEPGGYHAESGRAARPLGGWWVKFTYAKEGDLHILKYEERRAK